MRRACSSSAMEARPAAVVVVETGPSMVQEEGVQLPSLEMVVVRLPVQMFEAHVEVTGGDVALCRLGQ